MTNLRAQSVMAGQPRRHALGHHSDLQRARASRGLPAVDIAPEPAERTLRRSSSSTTPPTDGTSDMVQTLFPEVRLLRNEVNQHYASSNNRAIRAGARAISIFTEQRYDRPAAGARSYARISAEHPEAGAVGSKLLNGDGTVQWSVKSLPNPGSALFGSPLDHHSDCFRTTPIRASICSIWIGT